MTLNLVRFADHFDCLDQQSGNRNADWHVYCFLPELKSTCRWVTTKTPPHEAKRIQEDISMLTVTSETTPTTTPATQNEKLPSDIEISRRVMKIRSQWSPAERVRRRREAEDRFAALMDKLTDCDAA